ncbi:MAG: acetate--CoA ligase family protein [Aeromicrobium sp.]
MSREPDAALHAALFAPRSVAIVGASDDPTKLTARPLANLRRTGWSGDVFPVNPTRDTVMGEQAWPSLGVLPVVPDHVFVLTGADLAVEAVREAADLGVGVVTVMADDFVDDGPDATRRRAALTRALDGSSTRLLGPSSLGVASLAEGLVVTANAAFSEGELPTGGMFVASQSGSAMGSLVSRGKDMGTGFRALVSTGSELDVTLGEICLSSVDDPLITSYALFMEHLKGADDLRAFAVAAAQRSKPVLVYKLGRSQAGASLAVSHTGALAGDDAVADALFRDLGFGRVSNFEALLEGHDLARAVPLSPRGTRRPRIGVLSTTGGGGAMMIDCLAVRGAEIVAPSAETLARLEAADVSVGSGALVDVTLAGTRYEVMRAALDILTTAPEFDAVVAVPGSSARFHPELAVKPIADSIGTGSPLAAFVVPSAPDALRLLRDAGVSAFRTPEACADAVLAVFGRQKPVARDVPVLDRDASTRVLDEVESYEVLAAVGLEHAAAAVVAVADLPGDLPVPGPAVVKLLSDEISHKSDVGGVVLGIVDGDGLARAAKSIVASVAHHAPGVAVEHLLVQSMVSGLGEVLVGFRHDRDAGPIVVLAAGGVLAELYQDRSVRTAPVDLEEAGAMIDEVVALQALDGYRGAAPGDLGALARAVTAMSQIGLTGGPGGVVVEAEVNPLIVRASGVVAVDALVRRTVGS